MNEREKEVAQYLLEQEKTVLKKIESQFRAALNSINMRIALMQTDEMTASQVLRVQYQKTLKAQVSAILEKLHADEYNTIEQFAQECYKDGFIGTMYNLHGQNIPIILSIDNNAAAKAIVTDSKIKTSLYEELGVDVAKLKSTIAEQLTIGIASNQPYINIAHAIRNATGAPLKRAKTIVRTEAHRIQQASQEDARQEAKAKGAEVVKQWDAILDGRTRDNHARLDGQIREVDEPFTIGGKKAMYPGAFGDPAEDCNCRCVALTRARAALDADELQTLKDRAKYFGLNKSKDFKDFKDKYLKATPLLESPGNTGEKAIPYSKRGIELEERIKGYMKELPKAGNYITGAAGSYSAEDMATLTVETGVEYTLLTIGDKSYMIRGTENGTVIPDELYEALKEKKGTLDFHSHPYIGDLSPSKSDRKLLELLTWQEESGIIEPGRRIIRFNKDGAIGEMSASEKRDEDYYRSLFGEGD